MRGIHENGKIELYSKRPKWRKLFGKKEKVPDKAMMGGKERRTEEKDENMAR